MTIKNIIFDFDGVILDSMPIRDFGFREIFKEFSEDLVGEFLEYHRYNGGISRYIKIRYFYEELLNQSITENEVINLAEKFSIIMKKELINKKYLINQSVNFIKNNHKNYKFHIASGSDQVELRYLCKELGLSKYFLSIHGSPTHKNDLVKDILKSHGYKTKETILIGDSINDYQAADINSIDFYGFNNIELKIIKNIKYINTYKDDFEK
jgi:phosphoglycolate phosphatase-like HAD superfamily hydrolase